MPTIEVFTADPNTGQVLGSPLTMDAPNCEFTIQPVPGSSAVHLFAKSDDASVRAEIALENEDPIRVRITLDDSTGLLVSSAHRRVFTLPVDDRYAASPPLRLAMQSQKADLLFLIDGTTRFLVSPKDKFTPPFLTLLLDPSNDIQIDEHHPPRSREQVWNEYIDALVEFASKIREQYPDLHTSVLAFGDESVEFICNAVDLRCGYTIYPGTAEERKLRDLSETQLKERLAGIPATSGGDYVDALAEALYSCGAVGWRDDARHILVLFGDSPGFSLTYPPPRGVDIHVRRNDVDVEAMKLHSQHNTEIVTIYAGASSNSKAYGMAKPHPVLDYSSEQYSRLATLRSWAWSASTFKGSHVANCLLSGPAVLGRQSCAGILTQAGATAGPKSSSKSA